MSMVANKVLSSIGLLLAVFLGSFGAEIVHEKVASRRSAVEGHQREPDRSTAPAPSSGIASGAEMLHQPAHHDAASAGLEGGHAPSSSHEPSHIPGTVQVSTEKQQLIGVQVGTVTLAPHTQSFRTLGRVVPDENRLHRLVTMVDGWIREIHGSTTGSLVQKNQLLATYFTIEFLNKQQQYFYALDLAERQKRNEVERAAGASGDPKHASGQQFFQNAPYSKSAALEYVAILTNPVELSRVELRLMGVGEPQLEQITHSRQYASTIELRSPVTGLVLGRNVSPDLRIHRGSELFTIADLSRVWVLASIHERESRHIRPGLRAKITLPQRGEALDAVVSDVPPRYDAATRTYQVRMEVDNPGLDLRPDMVVDVEMLIHHPTTVTVPVDAILDSGLKKTVFVDMGNGRFSPIHVETGWRSEDKIQVTAGLLPGERIVVSGNFLLHSESRIQQGGGGGHDHHSSHHEPVTKTEDAPRKPLPERDTAGASTDPAPTRSPGHAGHGG